MQLAGAVSTDGARRYLIGDLAVAKRKYYGSFNNIRFVVGHQVNEMMVLHFLKSYVAYDD